MPVPYTTEIDTLESPLDMAFQRYLEVTAENNLRFISSCAIPLLDPDTINELDPDLSITQSEFALHRSLQSPIGMVSINPEIDHTLRTAQILREAGYMGQAFSAKYCQEALTMGIDGSDDSLEAYRAKLYETEQLALETYVAELKKIYDTIDFTKEPLAKPDIDEFVKLIMPQPRLFLSIEHVLAELNTGTLRVMQNRGVTCYYFDCDGTRETVLDTFKKAQHKKVDILLTKAGIEIPHDVPTTVIFSRYGVTRPYNQGDLIFMNPGLEGDRQLELAMQHEFTHAKLHNPDGQGSHSDTIEEGCANLLQYLASEADIPQYFEIPSQQLRHDFNETDALICMTSTINALSHTSYLKHQYLAQSLEAINSQAVYDKSYGHGALLMEFIYNYCGGLDAVVSVHAITAARDIVTADGIQLVQNGQRVDDNFSETKLIEHAVSEIGFEVDKFKAQYYQYKQKRLGQAFQNVNITRVY